MSQFSNYLYCGKRNLSDRFSYLLLYYLWGYPLFVFIFAIARRLPFLYLFASWILPCIFTFLAIGAAKAFTKNIRIADVAFCFVCAFIFLIHTVVFNNAELQDYAYPFLILNLPFVFLGSNMKINETLSILINLSIIVILWRLYYDFFYIQTTERALETGAQESMYSAYIILPHVLMIVLGALKHKKIQYILASFASVLLLFSYGTRGAVLDVLIFVGLYLLIFTKKSGGRWLLAVIVMLTLIMFVYGDVILLSLQYYFSELGVSTRIIDRLLGEGAADIADSSGRDLIEAKLLTAIKNSPFWGYGLCGSFRFVNTYPHNLFYEILISFGLFPGFLIFGSLIILMWKSFQKCNTDTEKQMFLLLFTVGFVKLFFSYTFLDNWETYLLIGYCFYLLRNKQIA